jgi:hypothetical protein
MYNNEDITLEIPEQIQHLYDFEGKLQQLAGMVTPDSDNEYKEYFDGIQVLIKYIREVIKGIDFVKGELIRADTLYEKYQLAIIQANTTRVAYETAVVPVVEEDTGFEDSVQGAQEYLNSLRDQGLDPTM